MKPWMSLSPLALTLSLGLNLAPGAQAAQPTSPLNDTGQWRCVRVQVVDGKRSRSWSTDCAGTGQDAANGRDVTAADPTDGRYGFSFAKVCGNGELAGTGSCPANPPPGPDAGQWACTLDRVTGLLWEMKRADTSVHGSGRRFTRLAPGDAGHGRPSDAAGLVAASRREALCGFVDWRLPEAGELQSLGDYGQAGFGGTPMIDAEYFPNTRADAYWTATPASGGSTSSFYFKFAEGALYVGPNSNNFPARVVRGGAAAPVPRFSPSADGRSVLDHQTGLQWQRCARGQAWDGASCEGVAERLPAGQVQALSRQLQNGWRVPTVKELASLVQPGPASPVIDTQAFPNTPDDSFWTSTVGPSLHEAYEVDFAAGTVANTSAGSRGVALYLRLVRSKDAAE